MKRKGELYFPEKSRQEFLRLRDNKCDYCDCPLTLDTLYIEHIDPFFHSHCNSLYNLAASCYECNNIKGQLIFTDLESARAYVQARRKAHPKPIYTYVRPTKAMPSLPHPLPSKPEVAEIRLPSLPTSLLSDEDSRSRQISNAKKLLDITFSGPSKSRV